MNEVWKDIKGYEKIYQVSNFGKVKRLTFINGNVKLQKERMSTPTNNGHGYLIVGLSKNGKRKNFYVHRLVAETFLDNLNNLPQVNHKDGNKKNNRVDNLEWCTASENQIHSYKVLKTKYNLFGLNISREKQKKKVSAYKNGKLFKTFNSISEAGRFMKVNPSCICGCCKGIYKTCKGYIWKYELN